MVARACLQLFTQTTVAAYGVGPMQAKHSLPGKSRVAPALALVISRSVRPVRLVQRVVRSTHSGPMFAARPVAFYATAA